MVPLFSCHLQSLIIDSLFARHVIGFLTLIFFVRLTGPEKSEFKTLITDSIILYIWFIATTRISSETLYIIGPLAIVYFILYIYKSTINSDDKDNDKKITETIDHVNLWITRLLGISIIIGVILYYGEKRLEYSNNFNIMTFIVGKIKCKKSTPSYTVMDKLSAVL
jgi:c-di-AMP phosphodiesterase-like protein